MRRFRGDGERLPGLCHLLRQGAGPAGAGRGGGLLSQPAGGGGARLCAVYRPDRGGGQDLRYCGVCHRLPSQGTPVLFCGGRRPGVLGAPDAGRHPPGRIQLRPVQRNGRRGGGIAAHGVPFQPGGTPGGVPGRVHRGTGRTSRGSGKQGPGSGRGRRAGGGGSCGPHVPHPAGPGQDGRSQDGGGGHLGGGGRPAAEGGPAGGLPHPHGDPSPGGPGKYLLAGGGRVCLCRRERTGIRHGGRVHHCHRRGGFPLHAPLLPAEPVFPGGTGDDPLHPEAEMAGQGAGVGGHRPGRRNRLRTAGGD